MKKTKYLFLALMAFCLTATLAFSNHNGPMNPVESIPDPPDIQPLQIKNTSIITAENRETITILNDQVVYLNNSVYEVVTVNLKSNPDIWWDYYGRPILDWETLSPRNGQKTQLIGHYGSYTFKKEAKLTLEQYIKFKEAWLITEGFARDQEHAANIILGKAEALSRKPGNKYKGNLTRFDLPLEQRRAIEDYVDWYSSYNNITY